MNELVERILEQHKDDNCRTTEHLLAQRIFDLQDAVNEAESRTQEALTETLGRANDILLADNARLQKVVDAALAYRDIRSAGSWDALINALGDVK